MGDQTKIEWTEATWNPWHGCHKVSSGCKNCYMFREKKHYGQDPNVVQRSKTKFYDPLKWKEPRTIFTCSWSDFFIEEADPWRDEAFAIMALTPQHTYQVLTKRPDRMLEYLRDRDLNKRLCITWPKVGYALWGRGFARFPADQQMPKYFPDWPYSNVWLGVSVEDQKTADERIPLLLQTPAALRWLSIEPLLGRVDLMNVEVPKDQDQLRRPWDFEGYKFDCLKEYDEDRFHQPPSTIDWVVVGGESGPDARPMHPDWARSLRDQCTAAGVPFFFKQWGEWLPFEPADASMWNNCATGEWSDGHGMNFFDENGDAGSFRGFRWMDPHDAIAYNLEDPDCQYLKTGKAKAGRLLDGREWNEMPEVIDG